MIDLQKKIIAQLQDGPASKMRLRVALMCSSDDLESAMDKLESVGLVESELVGSNYLYSNVRHVPAVEKKEVAAVAKTIKEQILDLFLENPGKPLKASDVIGLLPTANKGTIKAVIYKMAEVGELVKKGHFFLLPEAGEVSKIEKPLDLTTCPDPEVTRKSAGSTVVNPSTPIIGTFIATTPKAASVDASINMSGIVSITNGMSSIQLTKAEFQRVAEFVGGVGV